MLERIRTKLTYANVMATIAVFMVLTGIGFAVAASLPKKSVGPKQLRNGAVGSKKIQKNAVNSSKIKQGAVGRSELANGAVGTGKISNSAVTTGKISNQAVTRAKVSDAAIPFLGTLRSGQELRGTFTLGDLFDDTACEAITLQFPLVNPPAVPPQANIVDMTLPSPPTTASCGGLGGGNQQTPQAAPGQICVYLTAETNLDTLNFASNSVNRLGFGLRATGNAAGEYQATGLWAVTAP
jgi:hypothetical protein